MASRETPLFDAGGGDPFARVDIGVADLSVSEHLGGQVMQSSRARVLSSILTTLIVGCAPVLGIDDVRIWPRGDASDDAGAPDDSRMIPRDGETHNDGQTADASPQDGEPPVESGASVADRDPSIGDPTDETTEGA